ADIHEALTWLRSKGIEPEETSFGKPQTEPIVHTWMPAACVYFNDPDGNSLELITLLNDEPVVSKDFPYLSEWNMKQQ
ncbi:VOC family protein, partial [Priestia megaterium]